MTAKEVDRLIEWLKAHGLDEVQAAKCIKYVANGNEQDKND